MASKEWFTWTVQFRVQCLGSVKYEYRLTSHGAVLVEFGPFKTRRGQAHETKSK